MLFLYCNRVAIFSFIFFFLIKFDLVWFGLVWLVVSLLLGEWAL